MTNRLQIQKQLTYMRRVREIKESDLHDIINKDRGYKAVIIMDLIVSLSKLMENMQAIINDPNAFAGDKIKASLACHQFLVDRSELWLNSSNILNISREYRPNINSTPVEYSGREKQRIEAAIRSKEKTGYR